jgi:hypothetical protein
MTKCSNMNPSLPFLDELSGDSRRLAETALASRDKKQSQTQEKRSANAARVAADAHGRLEKLLGHKKYVSLRQHLRAERLAFQDLFQPPAGLKANFSAANVARKKKANEFLKKLDISRDEIEKIARPFHEGIAEALALSGEKTVPGHSMSGNVKKWLDLSPLHKFPLPWGVLVDDDPNDPHRWFLFRPPFFGFNFGYIPVHADNFAVDRDFILAPASGLAGVVATMDDGDAGDFDYASVDVFSEIAFGFAVPVTGLVEVLIDAQSTIGTHDLTTEDEWGWSNSTTGQTNYLKFDVLHPNVPEPSYAEMSSFSFQTSEDHTVHRENLVRGQHYFAHLFSAGPVPAGQSVVITAGTRSFDISGTNDVSIHSRSHFEWFINSVEVRISP